MSSTSKKHRNFVAEPMGEKRVSTLPGIGNALGKKLSDNGYNKAYSVPGKYMSLGKDETKFKGWLKDTCGANAKQQRDCHAGVKDWCNNHS